MTKERWAIIEVSITVFIFGGLIACLTGLDKTIIFFLVVMAWLMGF